MTTDVRTDDFSATDHRLPSPSRPTPPCVDRSRPPVIPMPLLVIQALMSCVFLLTMAVVGELWVHPR